jgi:uncharacterized Zn finger protein (UPF0148 family)
MSTEIKCPNCAHSFPIEEVMAEEYKKDLREKMLSFTKQKDDEYNKKLNEFSSQQKQQEQLFAQQQQARELEYQQSCRLTWRKAFVKGLPQTSRRSYKCWIIPTKRMKNG